MNENAFSRKIHVTTLCAEDHLSSIRILKNLPSHIIAFTGNKELSILLRAEACRLLNINQASDGRLRHACVVTVHSFLWLLISQEQAPSNW